MTFDDIRALADQFFEWPDGIDKPIAVTLTSAVLFAQYVLEMREKSLGTENSAGVDALRPALKQEQEWNNPGECSECHAPVGSVCSDADCPGRRAPRQQGANHQAPSLPKVTDEMVNAAMRQHYGGSRWHEDYRRHMRNTLLAALHAAEIGESQ